MTPTHAISTDEARRVLGEDRERALLARLGTLWQVEPGRVIHYIGAPPRIRDDGSLDWSDGGREAP